MCEKRMKEIIIISIIITIVIIKINKILIRKRIEKIELEKITMYECGFSVYPEKIPKIWNKKEHPERTKEKKYNIKYYIIGIIFLIFDLEAMLIYPITKILEKITIKGYTTLTIFIIAVIVGLIYEIKTPEVGILQKNPPEIK